MYFSSLIPSLSPSPYYPSTSLIVLLTSCLSLYSNSLIVSLSLLLWCASTFSLVSFFCVSHVCLITFSTFLPSHFTLLLFYLFLYLTHLLSVSFLVLLLLHLLFFFFLFAFLFYFFFILLFFIFFLLLLLPLPSSPFF